MFLFGSVLLVANAAAATVDPTTVGTWELSDAALQWRWIWDIRADGTYAFRAEGSGAVPPHNGTVKFASGAWSLQSTAGWSDSGSYRLLDRDTMDATGKLGRALWKRSGATQAVAAATAGLATASVNNQSIPSGLPALVKRSAELARGWRSDAVLVGLNVKPSPLSQQRLFVEMEFYSPSTRNGLWVMAGQPGLPPMMDAGIVDWGTLGIPPSFVDLGAALKTASSYGLKGPIDHATLRVWRPDKRAPVLAWSIAPKDGDVRFVDGMSGAYLPGDVTGYIESYNKAWADAAQRLRDAAQRSMPSSAGESVGSTPTAGPVRSNPPTSAWQCNSLSPSESVAWAGTCASLQRQEAERQRH